MKTDVTSSPTDTTNVSLDKSAYSQAAQSGAKGMIDIGRPFLDYVISALIKAGIKEVCLVIGPEHQIFRDHYQNLETKKVKISFAIQDYPLGTADAVKAAREFVGNDYFVVLNSDNYYPVESLQLLTAQKQTAVLGFSRKGLLENSNIPADRIAAFAILLGQPVATDSITENGIAKQSQSPTKENRSNQNSFNQTKDKSDGGYQTGENSTDKRTNETNNDVPSLKMTGIVEKPDPVLLAAHPSAPISMNAWCFSPRIFEACEQVTLSTRGEYELPDAVRELINAGEIIKILPTETGVLDMSQKTDIGAVRKALENSKVEL